MKYQLRTRIGLLAIAPHEKMPRLVRLWLGSFLIGTYGSVTSATDIIEKGKTGCAAIDKLPPEERSGKLADWERVEDSAPTGS